MTNPYHIFNEHEPIPAILVPVYRGACCILCLILALHHVLFGLLFSQHLPVCCCLPGGAWVPCGPAAVQQVSNAEGLHSHRFILHCKLPLNSHVAVALLDWGALWITCCCINCGKMVLSSVLADLLSLAYHISLLTRPRKVWPCKGERVVLHCLTSREPWQQVRSLLQGARQLRETGTSTPMFSKLILQWLGDCPIIEYGWQIQQWLRSHVLRQTDGLMWDLFLSQMLTHWVTWQCFPSTCPCVSFDSYCAQDVSCAMLVFCQTVLTSILQKHEWRASQNAYRKEMEKCLSSHQASYHRTLCCCSTDRPDD